MEDVSKASIVRTYERFAPAYDATFGAIVGRYHRHIGQFVSSLAAHRVLEVGVGTGLSLRYYPKGTSLVGVDICPRMLEKARRRQVLGLAANVELRLVDAEHLPFADESFDAVILPFVISVTPDPERLLVEVFRVLKPGGAVLILNHFAGVRGMRWLEALFSPLARVIGFRSDLALQRVVDATPMEIVAVRPLRPIGFFTSVHLRRP